MVIPPFQNGEQRHFDLECHGYIQHIKSFCITCEWCNKSANGAVIIEWLTKKDMKI